MKNTIIISLLLMLLSRLCINSFAQTSSGIITYEGMRKLDPSQIKIVINGNEVQAGSPDAPADLPDVVTFSQQLVFTKSMAKEVRENPGPVIRRFEGSPGGAGTRESVKVEPPFIENTFLDLANKKFIRILEIKKNTETQRYQSEEPFRNAREWKETGKTKKIAGYTCKKVTSSWNGEACTIWYTTDLDFTYSPINGLVPEKGVVLEIESSSESFKATKVEAKAVSENEIKPVAGTQIVPAAQFEDVRNKAMADFRQKMFSDELKRN